MTFAESNFYQPWQLSCLARYHLFHMSLFMSATSYYVQITCKVQQNCLNENDCCPLLQSIEITLISSFSLDAKLAQKLSK